MHQLDVMVETRPSAQTLTDAAAAAGATDFDLLSATRLGDMQAFSVLYQRHCTMASRVARGAGVLGAHDVADVVGEAFARVLRAIRGGRGPQSSFGGYLAVSVRRVAWQHENERRRYFSTDDATYLDALLPTVGADEDVEPNLVEASFNALPLAWRQLLRRVAVEGHRVGDIAIEQGRSANAVSATLTRARHRLRTEMDARARAVS